MLLAAHAHAHALLSAGGSRSQGVMGIYRWRIWGGAAVAIIALERAPGFIVFAFNQ